MFGENFPYTNFHDLNMDWIIKIAKDFLDQYTHIQETITNGEQSLLDITSEGLQELSDKKDELEGLLQDWYNTHSSDIANQLADALTDLNSWYTLHVNLLDTKLAQMITDFENSADLKKDETLASIPASYDELAEEVQDSVKKQPLGINLFDKNKVSVGYINWETGEIAGTTMTQYRASDFIEVSTGDYRIYETGNQQGAFYDANKDYIGGFSSANSFNSATSPNVPANAKYIRFTTEYSSIDNAGLYVAEEYAYLHLWDANYRNFSEGCIADRLKDDVKTYEMTVSTVQGLVNAINAVYPDGNYKFIIYLEEGSYVLSKSVIDTLVDHTYGMQIPNNVELVGLGTGARIYTDLTGEDATTQQNISPVNIKGNAVLKNLRVTVVNGRYAVHADNGNHTQNTKIYCEDCIFVHEGNSDENWNYPASWGAGSCSGQYAEFNNCTFISPFRAFYMHNNTDFTEPSHFVFNNCNFIAIDNISIMLESMGSGVRDVVELNGCKLNGLLDGRVNSSTPTVTDNDFDVIGHGNSLVCEQSNFTGKQLYSHFSDECIMFKNNSGSNMFAGSFMKMTEPNVYEPMTTGDDNKLFFGVLLANVNSGDYGYIKYAGCLRTTSGFWNDIGDHLKANPDGTWEKDNTTLFWNATLFKKFSTISRYYIKLE